MLISSGQPGINPRLVKEADALAAHGYEVVVLYQYLSEWATRSDKVLLPGKQWTAIRVGGSPGGANKLLYHYTRVRYRLSRVLVKVPGLSSLFFLSSAGRCTVELAARAKSVSADLYIAHNLAALPAAVIAAKKNKARSGFDAEDLHRFEISDQPADPEVRLKTAIEDKYLPAVDYMTASSPLIAQYYESLYRHRVPVILNVFPRSRKEFRNTTDTVLHLFWFSQTVGLNRGLQDILKALALLGNYKIDFHIIGNYSEEVKSALMQLHNSAAGADQHRLIFHGTMPPDELLNIADRFDIGLATEPGFSLNNKLALSNKLFTYLRAGLAILVSDTPAQKQFMEEHPATGKTYPIGNALVIAGHIRAYLEDRDLLLSARKSSYDLAKEKYNWETEQEKLIDIIKELG